MTGSSDCIWRKPKKTEAAQKMYPTIDMKATGRRLRLLIRLRGLTVREVQEYLGLAWPHSIYHWFDGKNLPTLDNLYSLSGLLNVPIDLMLCGTRPPSSCKKLCRDSRIIEYLLKYAELERAA